MFVNQLRFLNQIGRVAARILGLTLLVFALVLTLSAEAKGKKKRRRKKRKGQIAIVAVQGAAVYQYPNFDSKILDYLKAGTKVLASLKSRQGIGGFGAFYKVKLPNKKVGWMTDVDILPKYKAKPGIKDPAKEVNPDFEDAKSIMENAGREPAYFEKYVGAQVGMVQFAEKFEGRTLSSDVLTFGLRGRGPGLLFDGPPLDASLSFSIEAPSYYDEFASGEATGFFVMGDLLFPFPFITDDNFSLTLGVGPMFAYTRFNVPVRTSEFDSQDLRLGFVGSLGVQYRIKKISLMLDAKYNYETVQYFSATFGLLFRVK